MRGFFIFLLPAIRILIKLIIIKGKVIKLCKYGNLGTQE